MAKTKKLPGMYGLKPMQSLYELPKPILPPLNKVTPIDGSPIAKAINTGLGAGANNADENVGSGLLGTLGAVAGGPLALTAAIPGTLSSIGGLIDMLKGDTKRKVQESGNEGFNEAYGQALNAGLDALGAYKPVDYGAYKNIAYKTGDAAKNIAELSRGKVSPGMVLNNTAQGAAGLAQAYEGETTSRTNAYNTAKAGIIRGAQDSGNVGRQVGAGASYEYDNKPIYQTIGETLGLFGNEAIEGIGTYGPLLQGLSNNENLIDAILKSLIGKRKNGGKDA